MPQRKNKIDREKGRYFMELDIYGTLSDLAEKSVMRLATLSHRISSRDFG